MFNGCSKLTDISGTRFGAGITTTTEWIPTSQILYANNISLNSQNIKFKDFNNLIQCNNLVINPSLTNLDMLFMSCSSITNIDLSNNSLPNCKSILSCKKVTFFPFSLSSTNQSINRFIFSSFRFSARLAFILL